mmetsp:Transcript_28125/g.90667  ORF Transcript_28125/g.90667 Transcript_28125/m.90667 type:complete len:440 (-) Transcript_28125:677-1996(-)
MYYGSLHPRRPLHVPEHGRQPEERLQEAFRAPAEATARLHLPRDYFLKGEQGVDDAEYDRDEQESHRRGVGGPRRRRPRRGGEMREGLELSLRLRRALSIARALGGEIRRRVLAQFRGRNQMAARQLRVRRRRGHRLEAEGPRLGESRQGSQDRQGRRRWREELFEDSDENKRLRRSVRRRLAPFDAQGADGDARGRGVEEAVRRLGGQGRRRTRRRGRAEVDGRLLLGVVVVVESLVERVRRPDWRRVGHGSLRQVAGARRQCRGPRHSGDMGQRRQKARVDDVEATLRHGGRRRISVRVHTSVPLLRRHAPPRGGRRRRPDDGDEGIGRLAYTNVAAHRPQRLQDLRRKLYVPRRRPSCEIKFMRGHFDRKAPRRCLHSLQGRMRLFVHADGRALGAARRVPGRHDQPLESQVPLPRDPFKAGDFQIKTQYLRPHFN